MQISDRDKCNAMARQVLKAADLDFDKSGQLRQALAGTFLFGMLTAEGMSRRQSASEVQARAVEVFQDTLHYAPLAAQDGVQQCVDACAPGGHDTMKAIVHRGIDGHRQYLAGDFEDLRENVSGVLNHFAGSGQ